MKIAVAIPHYENIEKLGILLSQLRKMGENADTQFDEIIVLDDASRKKLALENLAKKFREVKFIFGKKKSWSRRKSQSRYWQNDG
jgi:glycosyltransferase involved in cell wall biosynthesis